MSTTTKYFLFIKTLFCCAQAFQGANNGFGANEHAQCTMHTEFLPNNARYAAYGGIMTSKKLEIAAQ